MDYKDQSSNLNHIALITHGYNQCHPEISERRLPYYNGTKESSQSKLSLLMLKIILRVLLALKEGKAYIKPSQVAGAVVKNLPAI